MTRHVTIKLNGQALQDAMLLLKAIEAHFTTHPIAITGRNLLDIQNDYLNRSETFKEQILTSKNPALAPLADAIRNLKLDIPAIEIKSFGTGHKLLHSANTAFPEIYLDDVSKDPQFYGYYPEDYKNGATLPAECTVLTEEEAASAGSRLFAGGWSTPHGLFTSTKHGIALPADFQPSDIALSTHFNDWTIHFAPQNDPTLLDYKEQRDLWEENFSNINRLVRESAQSLIDTSSLETDAPLKDIHINMMTSYPQKPQEALKIEIGFKSGIGLPITHGTRFDCFDLKVHDNRLIVAFHERTETASSLKKLADSIGPRPEPSDFFPMQKNAYLHSYQGHDFLISVGNKGTELDNAGYKTVPLALYQWLRMEAENAQKYDRLPPRDETFYTMYREALGNEQQHSPATVPIGP